MHFFLSFLAVQRSIVWIFSFLYMDFNYSHRNLADTRLRKTCLKHHNFVLFLSLSLSLSLSHFFLSRSLSLGKQRNKLWILGWKKYGCSIWIDPLLTSKWQASVRSNEPWGVNDIRSPALILGFCQEIPTAKAFLGQCNARTPGTAYDTTIYSLLY